MDDVLVYTDGSEDNHWKTVCSVLSKLEKAGLFLDIDKCDFLCKKVKYLGFIIEAGKNITADPAKVKAIQEWEAPKTVEGVRSFLGFANFYRWFIDKFSEIAAPLIELTKKKTPWHWGQEECSAFENLKKTFASTPVLAQWDPERETVLEADCSGYALGGCLSQLDDGKRLRPIAYFSRRLSGAEANYPIHDKEMLAIVACLKEWQAELKSTAKPFTILSDHRNLNYFASKKLLNERQVRYNDVLQQFNFQLKWRSGNSSERPDALSRREQDKPVGLDDERNAGRLLQLLPNIPLNPISTKKMGNINNDKVDPAGLAKIFEDEEMQSLWALAVEKDKE